YPCAFLFEGDTGTGKTSAALLLAEALGVNVVEGPFGGLHQIASGEQSGQTVREKMRDLRSRPFFGSGWQGLIVNESDAMTASASIIWLDALEDLPPRCVVVFTTNCAAKIPARLRDRCERLSFEGSAMLLRPAMQEMTNRVWREEGCQGEPPDVDTLKVSDEQGNASFPRLLQVLTPLVRSGQEAPRPVQVATTPAPDPLSDESLHQYGKRWAAGESLGQPGREVGLSPQALAARLKKLGYRKGV